MSAASIDTLFSTIQHIKEDDSQREYLLELQKLVVKQKEETTRISPFSMRQIIQRFESKTKYPSISTLI